RLNLISSICWHSIPNGLILAKCCWSKYGGRIISVMQEQWTPILKISVKKRSVPDSDTILYKPYGESVTSLTNAGDLYDQTANCSEIGSHPHHCMFTSIISYGISLRLYFF